MRLAAQPLLELSKKQYLEILEAMVVYRSTLEQSDKAIFDVSYKEVVDNERVAELDGMQMRSIKDALEHKARKLLSERKIHQHIHYRILAAKTHTKLVCFQELYGPAIKKTACAPTQTA